MSTFGGRARWPGDRILAGLFDDFREPRELVEFFHDFRVSHELLTLGGEVFPFVFKALDEFLVLFVVLTSIGVDFKNGKHGVVVFLETRVEFVGDFFEFLEGVPGFVLIGGGILKF